MFRLTRHNYTFGNSKLEDGATGKLWVDAATRLPAQIVLDELTTKAHTTFEDFVWNEPLDKSLFPLTPPEVFPSLEAPPGD